MEGDRARRFEAMFDEAMFDEHARRVYAYALRRSTPHMANEVVGETFLIVWRKLDSVPAEPLP